MDNLVSLIKTKVEMNLEARKIEFIQEFLKVQNEEIISSLEKLLKKENNILSATNFEPMTKKELNRRIDQSELDFSNNNHKSSSKLLAKYK